MKTFCPYCGKENTEHMNARDETGHVGYASSQQYITPEPGDVSICIRCGQYAVFTDNGTLREPTDDEAREFARDHDMQVMRAIWERTCKTNSPPTTH
ncbi:hypothetical protein [Burkholderia sp. LMG 21824]|uniref:hypothetical protein n=1 Tax=Burkholderia sp. LMG 21824 TaxID=3158172 RepID=UPI003C2AF3F8